MMSLPHNWGTYQTYFNMLCQVNLHHSPCILTGLAESTDGEQPPTARAIKERISKIRELLKQAGVELSSSSASTKRGGRVKKAGSRLKATPGGKATSHGRKNKRQTAAPEPKDPAEDNDEDPAEFEDQAEHPQEDKDEDSHSCDGDNI